MNVTDALEAAKVAGIDPITILTPEEIDQLGYSDEPELSLGGGHYDNLVGSEDIDQSLLGRLGNDVLTWMLDDEGSRTEWVKSEKKSIMAVGISKDSQTPDFVGATTAVHPLYVEAVEQVHNRALTEMRPPNGNIVKTVVIGEETDQTRDQAERVQGFMNYQYTSAMPDEFNEHDKMLFRLPISGSCFKTIYYCERTNTFNAKFIEPSDFIVPWNATDLETAPRYTYRYYETHSSFQRNQASGFYVANKVTEPSQEIISEVKKGILEIEGSTQSTAHGGYKHQILKCSCDLDLEEGNDYALPYLVWVEYETQEVLRVQRNWKPKDEQRRRIVRDVHYRFAQGLGFYGYGLYHLMNGTIDATTEILKTIINSGILDANPRGYRTREAKLKVVDGRPVLGEDGKLPPPGYYPEVNSTAEELNKAFFTIPSKPPPPTLLAALEYLDKRGQSFAGTSGVLTGDSSMSNTQVGTILALIEQGGVTFSAIYQRMHNAQTQEFRILAEVIAENLSDDGYPYRVAGKESMILASDFDDRVDIVPVSTPDAASKSHRVMQANALAEMINKFPGLVDPKWVLEQVLDAMRINVPDDKWIPQHPSPMLEAQVAKLQAEIRALEGKAQESVANVANKNMQTVFSGVQAGVQVVQQAGMVPVVDELMKTVGFVDHNGAPVTGIAQGAVNPDVVRQNTSPGFPPIPQQVDIPQDQPGQTAGTADALSPNAGIETEKNEPL
jgi:hypothetical protein